MRMEVLESWAVNWSGFRRIRVLFNGRQLEGTWDVGVQEAGWLFVLKTKVVQDSVVGVC